MRYLSILLLAVLLWSCKETQKKDRQAEVTPTEEAVDLTPYPETLRRVLDAHGGLDTWKSHRGLVYEIPKEGFSELHTIDLYSRMDRVDTPDFSMGFDGEHVWILDPDDQYDGDPVFYHNLMFYFYAMPFVLADPGIIYSETEDLVYEGRNYPGLRISYQADIGTSPDDEYFIHYDPETYQMAWLGYTVTYRTGEKSENVKWIRYPSWTEVGEVVLPETLTWHNYEGRQIGDARSSLQFVNAALTEDARDPDFFAKPQNAEIAEPQTP